nr:hypothetical protein [Pandoravirus massiliensis]
MQSATGNRAGQGFAVCLCLFLAHAPKRCAGGLPPSATPPSFFRIDATPISNVGFNAHDEFFLAPDSASVFLKRKRFPRVGRSLLGAPKRLLGKFGARFNLFSAESGAKLQTLFVRDMPTCCVHSWGLAAPAQDSDKAKRRACALFSWYAFHLHKKSAFFTNN